MEPDPIQIYIAKQSDVGAGGVVKTVLPGLREFYSNYGHIQYDRGTGMRGFVCYIAGYSKHINLGFMRGTDLVDTDGIVEGSGKSLRHVKLRSIEEIEQPAIRNLLEQAGNLP